MSTDPNTRAMTRPAPRDLPDLSPVARVGLLAVGWLLILIGIAGLVLPGIQGILTIVFGAAALSLVSQTATRLLERLFRPWPNAWRSLLSMRRRLHGWVARRF